MQRVVVVVACLSLAACKSSTSPPGPLQGSWTGSISSQFTIDLNLADHGGAVTGSGDMAGPAVNGGGPIFLNVTGGENGSTYRLNVSSQGFTQTLLVSGVWISKDTVTAALEQAGFGGDSLNLVRQ